MQCCPKPRCEPADRCAAASIGLNDPNANMLDMSDTALLKALNHAGTMPAPGKRISCPAWLRMPCDPQSGSVNLSLVASPPPASRSLRAAVSSIVLFAALSLFFVGCGGLQSGTTAKTTPHAPADSRTAHDAAPRTKQPEAPATPAQPVPQITQRNSETRPPSATVTRGAEKLVATTIKGPEKPAAADAPAPAHKSQRTTLPAQTPDPKSTVTQDSGAVGDAPITELVLKGPPHQAPQPQAGMKALAGLGLGLVGVALAVLMRLFIMRQVKPPGGAASSKDELKMPSELDFKESVMAPQEPAATERP